MKETITPATDAQIEHMKRFWKEMPDQPTQRPMAASLLKKDFLSLIARIEKTEASLTTASTAFSQINEIIFASGAPLGSEQYFRIRSLAANNFPKETP